MRATWNGVCSTCVMPNGNKNDKLIMVLQWSNKIVFRRCSAAMQCTVYYCYEWYPVFGWLQAKHT